MGDKVATIPTLGRRKLNDTALSNLNKFTTKYSNLEYAGIVAEFEEIQKESATLEKPEFKAFKENAARNKDTVENCPDATRVVLTCNVPPATDYYNGNHIRIPQLDRPFMAVQTPMKNTINDFWRLVFQEACSVVLLLGDTKESDTGDFWPVKAGDHTNYGDIFVNNRKVTKLDDFTVSAIEVLPDGCSNSVIANLVHYPQWSEKEAPKEHFLAFLRCWKQIPRTLFVDAPIAVASRMGQGRSGAVILLHAAVEAIATGKECDLKSILKEMRKQRPFLVATPEQYNWVIKKVILYFSMKVSEVREPLATLLKNQLPKSVMSDGECELHENESESSPPSFALFAPMVFILINIGLLISVSVMVYRIRKAQAQFRNLVEKLLNTSLNRGIGQRSQNKVQQYVRNPENNMIKYIQHITP